MRVGAQMLLIHFDDKFANELVQGMHGTSYFLLIVPSSVRPDDFSTLRQAFSHGAKLVGGGSGPP